MKMLGCLILFGVTCAIVGCSHREPTLDEVIDALPDEWGMYNEKLKRIATKGNYTVVNRASSTNNYVVLGRVIAVTNVKERIRLTRKLFNHFRRTPEWYVEHWEDSTRNSHRHAFLFNCGGELMFGANATPETLLEGWKITAEIVRDLEALIRLTGPEWQMRMQKRHDDKIAEEYAKLKKGIEVRRDTEAGLLYLQRCNQRFYVERLPP